MCRTESVWSLWRALRFLCWSWEEEDTQWGTWLAAGTSDSDAHTTQSETLDVWWFVAEKYFFCAVVLKDLRDVSVSGWVHQRRAAVQRWVEFKRTKNKSACAAPPCLCVMFCPLLCLTEPKQQEQRVLLFQSMMGDDHTQLLQTLAPSVGSCVNVNTRVCVWWSGFFGSEDLVFEMRWMRAKS